MKFTSGALIWSTTGETLPARVCAGDAFAVGVHYLGFDTGTCQGAYVHERTTA